MVFFFLLVFSENLVKPYQNCLHKRYIRRSKEDRYMVPKHFGAGSISFEVHIGNNGLIFSLGI